jgi:hypothetical protein
VTDTEGLFRFEGLETSSDWTYLVRVVYEDVVYSRGMLSFETSQDTIAAEIAVYETTTDGKDIKVEQAHIFATVADAGLSVTELYVFGNPTDRTYVGMDRTEGRRWTSKYLLPSGSHSLIPDDGSLGGRFLSVDGGFVDTEPHWPGSTQVLFSYKVDCPAGVCDLGRELTHPIANLNVLVADVGATVQSGQLAFQGKRDAQGGSFLNYVGRNLGQGQRLELQIPLPGATAATAAPQRASTQALPWIILATLITGLVLVYPYWRRRIEAAARKDR